MSYAHDVAKLRYGRVNDGTLRFSRRGTPRASEPSQIVLQN